MKVVPIGDNVVIRRIDAPPVTPSGIVLPDGVTILVSGMLGFSLVMLGATAAKSLFGSSFRLMAQRGQPLESDLAPVVFATIHPSAILRGSDSDSRQAQRELFTEDLRLAAQAALAR